MRSRVKLAVCFVSVLPLALFAACTHEPPPPAPPTLASAAPSSNAMIVSADAAPIADDARIHGNSLVASLDGFLRVCVDRPKISVESDGGMRVVNQTLPSKGNYFLDGKYVGDSMGCDLVVCSRATDQKIDLVEYQSIGSIAKPAGAKGTAAAFQSVDLTGKIHIELKYFADDKCQTPKIFSKDVVR
jgi:hypothetical protein